MGDICFKKYNDYELLYLFHSGVEEAIDVLFWKYGYLINARISNFHVPKCYRDDFYQEGCITLLKAIKTFDEHQLACFTSYFELLLKRRFITLIKKYYNTYSKIDYLDDFDSIADEIKYDNLILFKQVKEKLILSELESKIYDSFFIEYKKAGDIAKEFAMPVKSISNTKQRIIKKIKEKI